MSIQGVTQGRLRRPAWSDPRLLAGLLLIAIAVVAVSMTVRAADDTVGYYAAVETLTPGTVIDESSVEVSYVQIPGGAYIEAEAVPWGAIVTRTVGKGELVPQAALVDDDAAEVRPIAVRTSVPLADGIEPGSVVDVWVTSDTDGERATVIVGEALTVAGVERGDGAFAQGDDMVHVAVPVDDVGAFLGAVSGGGEIAVVGLGAR